MEERIVDEEITLVPYFPYAEVALQWYQDIDVCKKVDNIDYVYTEELLNRMYDFLNKNGLCYYIRYNGVFVGDITLCNNTEICIVVCKKYQNLNIGRRCVLNIISLAKEKRLREVKARIYTFNTQSRKMFQSIGFKRISEEWYIKSI